LSPGPGTPDESGICLALTEAAAETGAPLMGVCLGHQAIGEAFGGKVVRSPSCMHGKVSRISHKGHGLFAGLPEPMTATRYHSLMVERESLPDCLEITAESADGVIQGLQHRDQPIHGVQFHPESIASNDTEDEAGRALLRNFLTIATQGQKAA
ncbi:MAG: anthranilate synthase component II, partial [Rhodospirillales bacterium]